MAVVLVTGAATGIGNLTARELANQRHTVYASVRDLAGADAEHARHLQRTAERDDVDLRVAELDVTSQASADAAVSMIVEQAGGVDVVVHNAGHLYVGYVEAFTADDIAHLFDVNALGAHRVNRAVLPHMRSRRAGTLVYVGSTIIVTTPPFLGPYSASKAAFDLLALSTAYEVGQYGIDTTIVMPGAFTRGTEHFPNASRASDRHVNAAYAELDPLVARNEQATSGMFPAGADADPAAVAHEIARILALPPQDRPLRSVVDFTGAGVEEVNEVIAQAREAFVRRLGYAELLRVRRGPAATP